MESSQTQVSPENTGIPQGIPTGVFVANNQTPVTADTPMQNTQPVEVQASVASTPSQPAPVGEGALDKFFRSVARFVAKISGQPDPITGAPNTSSTAKKTKNIVGKVWNVANQAVEKATEVATKTADTVNQATEKIQQIVPPPTAAPSPEQSPVAQPNPQTPAQ